MGLGEGVALVGHVLKHDPGPRYDAQKEHVANMFVGGKGLFSGSSASP